MRQPNRIRPWVLAPLLALAACQTAPAPSGGHAGPISTVNEAATDPATAYAGEVLAYVLKVVLGRAGPLDGRRAWRSRGVDHELDFDAIAAAMTAPEGNRAAVLVYDAKLLGLFQVLYHYDPRLNLYGGQAIVSPYPSVELVALRLLLLQKLARNEPIRLAPLWRRRGLLTAPERSPSAADLAAVNLNADQFRLLQTVMSRRPHLLGYLVHPAVVRALLDIGALRPDALASRLASQAGTLPSTCPAADDDPGPVLRVAILPSLLDGYAPGPTAVLRPTPEYARTLAKLETVIRSAVNADRQRSGPADASAGEIFFCTPTDGPCVVVPENAAEVSAAIAPGADLVIVVLGQGVDRSLEIDPRHDIFPRANRLYIDITDVRYPDLLAPVSAAAAATAARRRSG